MQKNNETILILSGFVLIFFVLSHIYVCRLLFADGCTQDCTPNNYACYGDSYGVVCTCNSIVHGRTWSNTPTYGSTTGDVTVSFESEPCYVAHLCYIVNRPNTKCMKEFDIYKCKDQNDSECSTFTGVYNETHTYMNCKSWLCLEE